MEDVQQTSGKPKQTGINPGTKALKERERPVMRDLFKEFLDRMDNLAQIEKINLIYSNIIKKKPDRHLKLNKKLNRILYELEFGEKVKETKVLLKDEKKQFKIPRRWNSMMKRSKKSRGQILVFYLNIKSEIESPRLYPIYSGNMVIIRNKPYEVDPRAFWTWGKYKCLFIKEIDRRPVSNLDYSEIKQRGDATDSDEFLIKAAMKAMYGGVKKPLSKAGLIALGIIAAVIVGFVIMNSAG